MIDGNGHYEVKGICSALLCQMAQCVALLLHSSEFFRLGKLLPLPEKVSGRVKEMTLSLRGGESQIWKNCTLLVPESFAYGLKELGVSPPQPNIGSGIWQLLVSYCFINHISEMSGPLIWQMCWEKRINIILTAKSKYRMSPQWTRPEVVMISWGYIFKNG